MKEQIQTYKLISISKLFFCWTAVWVLVASLSLDNSGGLKLTTVMFILTFLSVFCLAFKIASLFPVQLMFNKENYSFRFYNFLSFFTLSIMIFYSIKASVIISGMNAWEYRELAFGTSETKSILFGGAKARLIYSFLVEGAGYFVQYLSLSFFLIYRNTRYIFIGFIVALLSSYIMLGRSGIYYYMLMLIVTYFAVYGYRALLKIAFIVISISVVLFLLTSFRGGGITFIDFIYNYLIGYHTYGFTLLDNEVNFTNLLPSKGLWFGQATAGSFSYPLFYLIEKTLNLNILYFSSDTYLLKNEFVTLQNGKEVNAFYTLYYDLYQDFGWFSVVILGGIGGWLAGIVQYNVSKNIYNISLYFLLINIAFASIFRNPLATNGFFGFIIFLLLFYLTSNSKLRYK